MNKSTKIYLKLFLTSGLIFGFLVSLWDYIDEGKIGFAKSIFTAVFFGGFMAWTFGRSMNK